MATGTIKGTGYQELWVNQSPTSAFAAQSIAFDYSNCEELLIKFYSNGGVIQFYRVPVSAQLIDTTNKHEVNYTLGVITGGGTASTGYLYNVARRFTLTSTGIDFTLCAQKANSNSAATAVNDQLIPVAVYGK